VLGVAVPTLTDSERRRRNGFLLERIVRAEYQGLVRLAASRLADPTEAEDVVQAACASFLASFDPESRYGTEYVAPYLKRAVINHALKLNRRRRRKPTAALDDERSEPAGLSLEDQLEELAMPEEVASALARLPEIERQVLVMRVLGYEPAEIRAALGLTPRSYRKRVERGAARMREALGAGYRP
jgi:RNA polymerase sigma factor (sigma-70 family)